MKLSLSLCLILVCVGLSIVVEGKRTTKSHSYSSTKTYYYSSSSDQNSDSESDRTYCELLDLPQVCTLEYVPVCAHIRDCEGDNCFETAGNVCAACKDGKYDYFVEGECPGDNGESEQEEETSEDDKLYCELLDLPQVCTLEYVPVCAHIRDCEGDDCFETAGNVCAACKDGKYDYFVEGECPGDNVESEQEEETSEDDKLYCELLDVPEVCLQVYDPVCAHLRDCEGDSCFETVGNGCTACSSEGKYDYFTSGECPAEQEEESSGDDRLYCELVDVPEVCPQTYDPVCAHLRDCEGDNCLRTESNGCTACSAGSTYDYFVSGECPQDDRLYCELLDVPEVCPQVYEPVCAHLRGCEGDDCFETIGNGCTACSSEGKYDYFVSGECPAEQEEESSEDDRLYCELLDIPQVCSQVYDPVCAHLRDCEGDNCFKTEGNGCLACGSEGKYDYFVSGECPEPERKYCDDNDRPDFCTKEYFPVCAHHSEGDESLSTAGNPCMACFDRTVDYYTLGAC